MSHRVFDNSENRNVIRSRNKQENNNTANTQVYKRVPLGGKNQNITNVAFNRSKSTLGSNIFNPPQLSKSNSTLGIPSAASSSSSVLVHQDDSQAKQSSLSPNRVSKRVNLEPVSDNTALVKRSRLDDEPWTDSLIKPQLPQKGPAGRIGSTLRTDALHARNLARPAANNMDPVKQCQRVNDIDRLVELHWNDEIESVPERAPSAVPRLFDEAELQCFSTPNNTDSDAVDVGEMTIEVDIEENQQEEGELGLNDTDLQNLLD
ncbi:uncharacterized protein LODBEIA_P57400 [Lodderomyces beijingensis]|uniref:Uncharacterized protein n=1 Tax=Lodderomyces beijingensis TaxID=1775926 RepID=A0ABP0ZIH1_9ASCO